MPNKSKRIKSLKIPKKYFFDFLRGHLDGDGNILNYYDPVYKNSKRLYLRFCSASLYHLKWLQERIKNLTYIKGYINKGSNVYVLVYAKRDSIKLLPKIYYKKNIPCLLRKYKSVEEFLTPG